MTTYYRPVAPGAPYQQYATPTRQPGALPAGYQQAQQVLMAQAQQRPVHQQPAPAPQPRQAVYYPETYPPGPLGFFLAPPGQRTFDHTLQSTPVTQGFFTTYPSRMRTGVTTLVQPETVTGGPKEREYFLAELDRELAGARSSGQSTPRIESPAPHLSRKSTTTTLSGRRAGRVNYAEKEESEEEEESSEEEIGEAASDPEDDNYGERRRRRDTGLSADHLASMRIGRIKKKHSELERGWTWLGDRVPAERVKSEIARVTKHKIVPEELLASEAERPEMLVPITVDYDVPSPTGDQTGIKIKDRFLWNANEPFYKPLEFATVFCEDLGIPVQHAETLAELIQAQLEEAQSTVVIDLGTEDATPEEVVWSDGEGESMEVDENGEATFAEPDCRIVINLDVQINTHVLRDRIEWDLSSNLPPAEFARHYCAELGLTGEAVPLVAHAIHEELMKHKRDALELDLFARTHPQEQAKWEKSGPSGIPRTTHRHGPKGLVGVWRDWWERDEFSPVLVELTTEEMERREVERNREARRMMRTLATSKRRR
ncbi:Chromatin structure-remodeling complex subunit sfh1 [Vanrija pseudolonga]|uniref:Chromatin structure-remodeling complex subunit sfh1 n=1 Tax=Vanrija pseudolonga TaxID=143232 RepID=A0AAF0YFB1_9TREE|nr:Chromatin structure-remodeling complex subunit sfh1 [Vanrija pseudolonga]